MHELSAVAASGGYSLVAMRGLLIAVASLVAECGLYVYGLQKLRRMGLGDPRHVGPLAPRPEINP